MDADVVVMAYVGGGADDGDPVLLRLKRHRERVLHVERAVVEPGQDVAVEVDHGQPRPKRRRLMARRLRKAAGGRRVPIACRGDVIARLYVARQSTRGEDRCPRICAACPCSP